MKTAFCLIFTYLFAALGQLSAQNPNPDTVKLLSWNIQMLPNGAAMFSKKLRKKQSLRMGWIVEYCNQNELDAIVFQEVFDLQMKRKLRRGLKKKYPYHIRPKGKFGKMTSSGVYIVSRTPIRYLSHCVYTQAVTEDKLAAKGCVLAEWKINGQTLHLGGTHLQSGGRESIQEVRNSQYEQIRTLYEQQKQPNIAQILAGDLNTEKAMAARYDYMLQRLDMQDYPLDDPRPFTSDSSNSWNREEKNPSQIDYVLMRPMQSGVGFHRQRIIRPRRPYKGEEMDYADHYGILCELLIPAETQK